MKKVLITGVAGFIGFHVTKRLLSEGYIVCGIDNINDYYDVNLKNARLLILKENSEFSFYKESLENKKEIEKVFETFQPNIVINLAAQAGVRYSLENPQAYIDSNVTGFLNILEGCRFNNIEHLIYASSSSVYGANLSLPFSTKDNVDHPMSLYAATKKSNELMAHTYSQLFNIPTTGLRFFTVYGPWGRPDMALFTFTKNILERKPIKVFNNGEMLRDFTYIDDIVESIYRLTKIKPKADEKWNGLSPDPSSSYAPYKIFNIGNNSPVKLEDFIDAIEKTLNIEAIKEMLPLQPGDVPNTYADVEDLYNTIKFKPNTTIKEGIDEFVKWYLEFYKIYK